MKSWEFIIDKNKQKTNHLILEISRGRVLLSVLEPMKVGKKTSFYNIYQKLEYINHQEVKDEDHLNSRYSQVIDRLLSGLEGNVLNSIKKLAVVLDEPWGGSFWLEVSDKNPKPIKFSKYTEDKLRKKAMFAYEDTIQSHKTSNSHRRKLVGLTLVSTALNGYFFENPYGHRAESISINFQYDLVSESMLDLVKKSLAKFLPHHEIDIMVKDALFYGVLPNLFLTKNQQTVFLIVDINHTIVIKKDKTGSIEKSVIQIGRETLIEKLGSQTAFDQKQADRLIDLFSRNLVEDSLVSQIKSACQAVSKMWQKKATQILKSFADNHFVPEQVILNYNEGCELFVSRENIEEAVFDGLPDGAPMRLLDFRDNVRLLDSVGIVSSQVAHLYVAKLLLN